MKKRNEGGFECIHLQNYTGQYRIKKVYFNIDFVRRYINKKFSYLNSPKYSTIVYLHSIL